MSVEQVKKNVADVQIIMHENIQKLMERDRKLEDLEDQAELLADSADNFKRKSTKIRKRMWCDNNKKCLMLLIVTLSIIAVIVAIIYFIFQ